MAHKRPADDGKRHLALDVPLESNFYRWGEESEERGCRGRRVAGGLADLCWDLVANLKLSRLSRNFVVEIGLKVLNQLN